MGKISRDELKAGDHIYTWRHAYIYSHHGIYIGEDTVIHFTRAKCRNNPCSKCGNQSTSSARTVVSSCLDCFLAGGKIYLFEYNVSWAKLVSRVRGGTCTKAASDSPKEVVFRANYLFLQNGFGDYNVFKNNCEDFAIYCKTSLLVRDRNVMGGSGQINFAFAYMFVFSGVTLSGLLRLRADIGIRKDVVKVSVEDLVHQMNAS